MSTNAFPIPNTLSIILLFNFILIAKIVKDYLNGR